jgi:transcriptional regulator with XRE-family HTH domain
MSTSETETERRGASPLTLARLAVGLTQAELGRQSGVARETISRLETGAQTPRLSTARALAYVLGYEFSLIFPDMAAPRRVDGAHATRGLEERIGDPA